MNVDRVGRRFQVTMNERELLAIRFGLALAHRLQGFEIGGLATFVRTLMDFNFVTRDRVGGVPELAAVGDRLEAEYRRSLEPPPVPKARKRRPKRKRR